MKEPNYLERMRQLAQTYALPKGAIELEITETAFADFDKPGQRDRALKIVQALHEMGFAISMDDFGSGYSSVMLLNMLPMDVMKLDRSLLSAINGSARMQQILTSVIRLGKDLHMEIICEGIEDPEQEQLLLQAGCYYGQGYLFSKPLPEEEFRIFMQQNI